MLIAESQRNICVSKKWYKSDQMKTNQCGRLNLSTEFNLASIKAAPKTNIN